MDLLGETNPPRRNGFTVRQINLAWIEQANWTWYFFRRYVRGILKQLLYYTKFLSFIKNKKQKQKNNRLKTCFFYTKNTTVYI